MLTSSVPWHKFYDDPTMHLLRDLAKSKGTIVIPEDEFERDFLNAEFFQNAVKDKLVRFTPSSALFQTHSVFMLPAGWRAVGVNRPSLGEKIRDFLCRF